MKETRKVYNGYREALLTGLEIKKKYQDSYLGAYRHRSTYLALTIPQYLDLIKIEDHAVKHNCSSARRGNLPFWPLRCF